jgi:hypothetical protein
MLAEMRRLNAFLAAHPLTRRRRLSATARVLRWQVTSRIVGMREFAYDAFAHRLVPANEVPMANALFLRDPDHVANRVSQAHPVRILGTMV